MKRTPLNRVGKIGLANLEANKRIRAYIEYHSIPPVCEVGLTGCLRGMFLQIAHRHKRAWYKGDAELLSDYSQWVSACQHCHNIIENQPEYTEKLFIKLRPKITTTGA